MSKKKKLAIIDANAIIYRGYHALPPFTTKDGVLVNAVYGFANILLKVLKDIKPDYITVCFDVAKKTFRNDLYQEYKANREKAPQELYDQFAMVRELIKAFNMTSYGVKGYEADDLIGTIVKLTPEKEIEDIIVTGDMDALQLVDNSTKVYTLRKGMADTMIYDIEGVKAKYGFGPEQVVDYKALRGDPSDNIPGVKGIGEKTATSLIQEFGNLEAIYKFIDKVDKLDEIKQKEKIKEKNIKPGIFAKLVEFKQDAFLSKKLATIKQDVKIDFDLAQTKVVPFDAQKVAQLFQAWNFKSLINRIPAVEKIITKGQVSLFKNQQNRQDDINKVGVFEIREGYNLVDSEKEFDKFIKILAQQKEFAIDTETTGVNPFMDKIIGMSFSWQEGKGYYLPVDKIIDKDRLNNILSDNKIEKVGHNIKFDLEVLQQAGFDLKGIKFDTMVASYLLNPGSRQHKLDTIVFTEFGWEMVPIEELIGKGAKQITMDQIDIKRVADYACEDADYTWRLYRRFKKQLIENNLDGLMETIENPLIHVLAEIETNGILLDTKFLNKMNKELVAKISKLEQKIYKIAGQEFNVASPIQLKEILFDKLKISTSGLAKTKTGISTAAAELEKLKGVHPIINLISEYREITKLKSTYTEALPKLVNPKTGRIHTSFNQTVTATGRLSSSNPNLQNIPLRTELGKKIRQAFIAPQGYQLVAIDYSQIELRIAAMMSGDKKMIEAFKNNEDIHTRTAAEIFDVPLDKVESSMRRKAKEVNFGILYGLGARGLAQRTNTSYDEALAFIDKYFEIYAELKEYLEETIALAHDMEYVETLFGRKRYLPEINTTHQQLRAAAERMAINHPIQGTAADLIKKAMIKISDLIQQQFKNNEVKMILQIHDELIFEIKEEQVKKISELIKDEMETVYKLKVPLVAEVGIGNNWGECK